MFLLIINNFLITAQGDGIYTRFSAQERREGQPAASQYGARRLAGPPPRVRQALGGPRLPGRRNLEASWFPRRPEIC